MEVILIKYAAVSGSTRAVNNHDCVCWKRISLVFSSEMSPDSFLSNPTFLHVHHNRRFHDWQLGMNYVY